MKTSSFRSYTTHSGSWTDSSSTVSDTTLPTGLSSDDCKWEQTVPYASRDEQQSFHDPCYEDHRRLREQATFASPFGDLRGDLTVAAMFRPPPGLTAQTMDRVDCAVHAGYSILSTSPTTTVEVLPAAHSMSHTETKRHYVSASTSIAGKEGTVVSIGSVGHPFNCCGEGCKWSQKSRGCRDGASCTRCHLCKWRPSVDKAIARKKKAAEAAYKLQLASLGLDLA
eukprot:TRINITY_DN18793_c0_g3_i1.p1 TRINITY_DN18793_c0_g3~~TRINITY_DN18793_c0_g3_i1.p1  ORF type:complete len:225 (-),score=15.42 TRINITY_DN18793_c0_g3_i1:115-789(-)